MAIQKKPPQKPYVLSVDTQSYTVDFTMANQQFDWLEIFLVYDKSNKHTII